MTLPIVITILRCGEKYLFIKRKNPPYEGLWSMIGGKVRFGEHIAEAAIREVREETGAMVVSRYDYRGMVSERLLDGSGKLIDHFLIFVGYAEIEDFRESHQEGDLDVFSIEEIAQSEEKFLPSDLYMFNSFRETRNLAETYEAELVRTDDEYRLNYYREMAK